MAAHGWSWLGFGLLAATGSQAAEHTVVLSGLSFSPSQLTIQAGDTVRWENRGGCHDVTADDGSFGSGPTSCANFVFSRQFDQPGAFGYHCTPHGAPGAGMFGRILVEAAAPTVTVINRAIDGSWFNPATSGQGFLIETYPPDRVFSMAWFTWTAEGGYDWYVGVGSFEDNIAELDVFRSSGGRFNDPAPVDSVDVGDATFTLRSCSEATFDFVISDPPVSGSIPLTRILPAGPECVPGTGGTTSNR